ncbi:hypothetical protein ACFS07_32090 [Undibacterium arcticum]
MNKTLSRAQIANKGVKKGIRRYGTIRCNGSKILSSIPFFSGVWEGKKSQQRPPVLLGHFSVKLHGMALLCLLLKQQDARLQSCQAHERHPPGLTPQFPVPIFRISGFNTCIFQKLVFGGISDPLDHVKSSIINSIALATQIFTGTYIFHNNLFLLVSIPWQ